MKRKVYIGFIALYIVLILGICGAVDKGIVSFTDGAISIAVLFLVIYVNYLLTELEVKRLRNKIVKEEEKDEIR